MVSHVKTVAFHFIEAVPVDVQVMVSPGTLQMPTVRFAPGLEAM